MCCLLHRRGKSVLFPSSRPCVRPSSLAPSRGRPVRPRIVWGSPRGTVAVQKEHSFGGQQIDQSCVPGWWNTCTAGLAADSSSTRGGRYCISDGGACRCRMSVGACRTWPGACPPPPWRDKEIKVARSVLPPISWRREEKAEEF